MLRQRAANCHASTVSEPTSSPTATLSLKSDPSSDDTPTTTITDSSDVLSLIYPKLLSIDKIPTWYGENPYIRTGYRPVFSAAAPCFRSWLYLHNQSGNIYTHLIPGIAVATAGNAALSWYLATRYPGASLADCLVLHVYLTACAGCFGISAAYHTLLCHSRELADLWIRLDYVGISVLIMASFVPGLYMGFYCEPWLLRGYLAMVGVCSIPGTVFEVDYS
jgi:adiponectin receptor